MIIPTPAILSDPPPAALDKQPPQLDEYLRLTIIERSRSSYRREPAGLTLPDQHKDTTTIAHVCYFAGSIQDYQATFVTWVAVIRPERCPHCGSEHSYILWGSYQRWVYTPTDRIRIWIERVRCRVCRVTDALLPSFLHMFRRYTLTLIQHAISLALDGGIWGRALIERIGPYHQPAPSTIAEWLWAFTLSAAWLLPWLQQRLLALDPHRLLDPGRPPEHLLPRSFAPIRNARRRTAFLQGWQVLRLAETLYAATRAQQPDLAFGATMLLAFLAAALGATGRTPRLLWPDGAVEASQPPTQSGRPPAPTPDRARPP